MKRTILRRNSCGSEKGGVMVMLLMVSTIMFISGGALLSAGVFHVQTVTESVNTARAKYYAEQAARKAIWRIGRTDPDTWTSWGTFSDETQSASFDSVMNIITATGHYSGVDDTILVHIELNPTQATTIENVIAYERNYETAGDAGTLTYPSGFGPLDIPQVPVLDTQYYQDNADFTYEGDQTFDGPLSDGIHFVEGNADVKNGTSLNGTLVATGTIKFQGHVDIDAQQVDAESEFYPAYYPAVASLDTTEVQAAIDGGNQNLVIHGILYARGTIDLNPASVTGIIIGKDVYLKGSYDVTYDEKYAVPPPALVLWPASYDPHVSKWVDN